MRIQPGDMIHVFNNTTGKYVPCEILMTFSMIVDDPAGFDCAYYANYVVYTDGTQDELGHTCVYASTYDPNLDDPEFLPIETEAEWEKIEQILEEKLREAQETFEYPKTPVEPPDPDLPFS